MTRTRNQMNDVERLLTETLDTYAADTQVAPDGLDRIAAKRSRRRWSRGVLPGLAVAGATLAVGLGAIVLANGGQDVARGPDVLGQPGSGPLDQFVQVGSRGVPDCGDTPTGSCDRWADAVGVGDGSFVVVGNLGPTPVVAWTDGHTWDAGVELPIASGDPAEVRAIATDGERFVAVGARYPKGFAGAAVARAPMAWFSEDGRTWEAGDLGAFADAGVVFTDVARTGAGFHATGLTMGGRADVLDLGLWASTDGRAWENQGWVGGPLSAAGVDPVVGIEAGARIVVYAEVLDADRAEPCGSRGVAAYVGDKDGVPAFANGDDPRRPSRATASPGLESAVLRPCRAATLSGGADGGAGVSATVDTTFATAVGVTWEGQTPTVYLRGSAPGVDVSEGRVATTSMRYSLQLDSWVGEAVEPIDEQRVELVRPAAATDGYRLAVTPVDGREMSPDERWSIGHVPGDGTGFGLGVATDDGSGWRDPVPADLDPADRRYRYGALSHGTCKGDGWGQSAVSARTWAVSGPHVLIVGRFSECLLREPGSKDAEQPWMPAVWIGPLP